LKKNLELFWKKKYLRKRLLYFGNKNPKKRNEKFIPDKKSVI